MQNISYNVVMSGTKHWRHCQKHSSCPSISGCELFEQPSYLWHVGQLTVRMYISIECRRLSLSPCRRYSKS